VVRALGQTGSQRLGPAFEQGVQHLYIRLHRLAVSESAGLVEGQEVQLAPAFQVHPTLDQDALARRCSQATDDGHRG